ncbi:galactoside alpha-(1,2)-fucosyltransferase 2-like [Liolophura sinensis]|uniref:galactoside alpha-(1,2)-fucosyltransferase 2-like n=1 Tax=Liolophura sinensis TaxID=3198878 RepID=UPI003158EAFA
MIPGMKGRLKTGRFLLVLLSGALFSTYLWHLPESVLNWSPSDGRVPIPDSPFVVKGQLNVPSATPTKALSDQNYLRFVLQSKPTVAIKDPVLLSSNRLHMLSNSWIGAETAINVPSESFPGTSFDVPEANRRSHVTAESFRTGRPVRIMNPTNSAIWPSKSLLKSGSSMDVVVSALVHLNNHLKAVDHRLGLKKQVMDSSNTYLSILFNGRLGNQMFEFASLLGTARTQGVIPVIPKGSNLVKIFNINITDLDFGLVSNFPRVGQKRDCAFDPIEGNFTRNQTMNGYFQSWRYFSDVFAELRNQFTFKDDIVKRARLALKTSIQSQHPHFSLENATFVGVHVRRGDMVQPEMIQFGYAVGSKGYLYQAMDHFRSKYKSVMFIVCSNDMEWTKETLPHQVSTFITGQEAEVDIAILSLCNHTIMTVGSYGWWSAWLAGGTTIYQIQQTIPGTELHKRFNLTDYMLPDWIGLNQTIVKVT